MSDQSRNDGLQALWQSQSRSDAAISLDEIHTWARHLETRVGRRNRREYIAAAILVAGYGPVIWFGPNATLRLGAALLVAATVFVVHHLYVRGTATALPADLARTNAVEFHSAQLLHQLALLKGVWLWALLPLSPGMATVLIGLALAKPEQTRFLTAAGILTALLMFGIHLLNLRAAARVQRHLDHLNEQR